MSDVQTRDAVETAEPKDVKHVLEMRRVSKIYAGRPVLDALDFDVPSGTVVGLLLFVGM